MDKIYDVVNRENGAFARCSEKYLIQWLARGFEVEGFVFDEPPKEEPIQTSIISNGIAIEEQPHLSSNNVEYISRHKSTQ